MCHLPSIFRCEADFQGCTMSFYLLLTLMQLWNGEFYAIFRTYILPADRHKMLIKSLQKKLTQSLVSLLTFLPFLLTINKFC